MGASPKPERYANQALNLLLRQGYRVTPVHPKLQIIDGQKVANSLDDVLKPVQTLTLYVGGERLVPQIPDILALAPARVIFNPGTECEPLQQALDEARIEWFEACTLVMLRTHQF